LVNDFRSPPFILLRHGLPIGNRVRWHSTAKSALVWAKRAPANDLQRGYGTLDRSR
jgi:hypothetical protein